MRRKAASSLISGRIGQAEAPVAAITRRASARPEIPNSLLRRYDRT
jgi:hypothetical protein